MSPSCRLAVAVAAFGFVAACSSPEVSDAAGDARDVAVFDAFDVANDGASDVPASETTDAADDPPSDAVADASNDTPDAGPPGPYAGLYVDGFDAILADPSRRMALLAWAQRNGFNALTLYQLRTVLSTTALRDALGPFLRDARESYGIREIVAVQGRGSDFATRIRPFEDGLDASQRFDGYNLEREWWNRDGAFSDYTMDLMAMRSAASSSTPTHRVEEYVGWFTDPLGSATESEIASTLVEYSDRTLVHDYRVAPDLGYTRGRLEALGAAAAAAGRVYDVIVLFSAEATANGDPNEFMGEYFHTTGGDHSFVDAYRDYEQQWNTTAFANRASLRLVGYEVFAYSQASWARP